MGPSLLPRTISHVGGLICPCRRGAFSWAPFSHSSLGSVSLRNVSYRKGGLCRRRASTCAGKLDTAAVMPCAGLILQSLLPSDHHPARGRTHWHHFFPNVKGWAPG